MPEDELNVLLSEQIDGQPGTEGLPALRRELEAHGTDVDKLCMRYVLDGEAGSNSSELNHAWFPTGYRVGKLDYDAVTGTVRADRLLADRGLRLADFASHPVSMKARLSLAETAALRLYTTPASESINVPLRDLARRERGEPHPLPVTVMLISKGVSKLRAVSNISEESPWKDIDLYCGMRNRELPEEFFPRGDTRLDLMSTTPYLDVALRYAASRPSLQGVIFRLRMQGSPERGADLTFLSAFPDKRESLFPPLSYLEPTGWKGTVHLGDATFTVVEGEPVEGRAV